MVQTGFIDEEISTNNSDILELKSEEDDRKIKILHQIKIYHISLVGMPIMVTL